MLRGLGVHVPRRLYLSSRRVCHPLARELQLLAERPHQLLLLGLLLVLPVVPQAVVGMVGGAAVHHLPLQVHPVVLLLLVQLLPLLVVVRSLVTEEEQEHRMRSNDSSLL